MNKYARSWIDDHPHGYRVDPVIELGDRHDDTMRFVMLVIVAVLCILAFALVSSLDTYDYALRHGITII